MQVIELDDLFIRGFDRHSGVCWPNGSLTTFIGSGTRPAGAPNGVPGHDFAAHTPRGKRPKIHHQGHYEQQDRQPHYKLQRRQTAPPRAMAKATPARSNVRGRVGC